MKRFHHLLAILVILSGFYQCSYIENFHRDGIYVEKEVEVGSFRTVQVEAPVKLILVKADHNIVKLSGPDFNMNMLELINEDDKLIIRSDKSTYIRKEQAIKVLLPIRQLKSITMNSRVILSNKDILEQSNLSVVINGRGAGSESNLNIKMQSFSLAAYGKNVGLHTLKGETGSLNLTMRGRAKTDASMLTAANASVSYSSIADSHLRVSNQLTVNMYSSGNIYVFGNPTINFKTIDPGWDVLFGKVIKAE